MTKLLMMTMPGRSGIELEAAERVAWICRPLMSRASVDEVELAVVEAILALRGGRAWGVSQIQVTCRILGDQRRRRFEVRVEYRDTACPGRPRFYDRRPALQRRCSLRILQAMMDDVVAESADRGRAIEMAKSLSSAGGEC